MSDKEKMPTISLVKFYMSEMEYVRRCGHHFRKYEECIDEKGDKFDECYKVHFVSFKNCYDKLLYSGY